MTNIPGINIPGPIAPFTDADTYPTHDSKFGLGGWREVADVTERDAIPALRLRVGMAVFVQGDGRAYIYNGSGWDVLSSGGGGGGTLIKVSGVNTSDQTTLDFIPGTDIAIANPSGGQVRISFSGQLAQTLALVSHKWLDSYNASTGLFTSSQPAFSDISGSASSGQIPNLDSSKITTGLLALTRGGTGVDLSSSGGATKILAQDASHVISARDLVSGDIPNLSAAKITSGLLALARGGTNADLSATGGTSFVLRQSSVGAAITVSQLASSDLSDVTNLVLLNANNAFTGSISFSKDLTFSGAITPTTLSGDVDNYNPTGFSTTFLLRVDPGTADRNITGLLAGSDGRLVVIKNIGTTHTLILKHQSASSTSANRFQIINDVVLQPGADAALMYDATTGFWNHFSRPGLNNILSLSNNSEVRIGSTTNIPGNTSRLYIFGGTSGCNVDIQGDGSSASSDQAVCEVESSDYDTTVNSIFMKFGGPTALGTSMGISNQLLAQLTVGGTTTTNMVIRTASFIPMIFGTSDAERYRISARGESRFSNSIRGIGAFDLHQIATPGAPTVTPHNGSASTWAYKVVAYDNLDQPTLASSAGQTTAGASTLDSTHWNDITWTEVAGALYYKIFRTTVATSPATTGVIGTVDSGTGTSGTLGFLRDNGLTGDGSSVPSSNTTGRGSLYGLVYNGSTSGSTLVVPSAVASGVLTLPAATDTLIARDTTDTVTNKRVTQRVVSLADATSFTLSADTADMNTQANTQSAGTLTANAPSGTPTSGQKLIFRIKSTNVQTYSWDSSFRGSTTTALPTASSGGGKTDYLGFIYNFADTKWDIVAYNAGS